MANIKIAIVLIVLLNTTCTCRQNKADNIIIDMAELTPQEKYVIEDKGTEPPFSGEYYNFNEDGVYTCKRCGLPLYRSEDKFDSGCGWPAFDDEIEGAIKRTIDADGVRVEITCAKCGAHLGHVFEGERFTPKNIRHCVNSISLNFTPAAKTDTAIFAGGCFWGVEYLMQPQKGVISVESGYIGGDTQNPTYNDVCSGATGHAEAVRVVYNPNEVDYETLAKLFFEIHDPTQVNMQGPDIGTQYRSELFFNTETEELIAKKLITELKDNGYNVATKVTKASTFYPAELYHQDYYNRKGTLPYCHKWVKRF